MIKRVSYELRANALPPTSVDRISKVFNVYNRTASCTSPTYNGNDPSVSLGKCVSGNTTTSFPDNKRLVGSFTTG